MAFGGPCVLQIAPNWVALSTDRPDKLKPVDMTRERTVAIRHKQGLLQIAVDGQVIMSGVCRHPLPIPSDFHGGDPLRRTQFGQINDSGRSYWRRVSYRVGNRTLPDFEWLWNAADGQWPDQYQQDRMIQIHGSCRITSAINKGTEVAITFPCTTTPDEMR